MGETMRVVVADDHPLMVAALSEAVRGAIPEAKIVEAHDFDSLSAALRADPDVALVLLDLSMPGVKGYSGLLYLRSEFAAAPVIVVSANQDRAVIRHCMEFGAAGYITKSIDARTMREAVRKVIDGGRWSPPDVPLGEGGTNPLVQRLSSLTPQQVRVLMLLSQGLLNKQIAYELGVSEATVKAHVSAILQKLKVESRTQAVILAAKIERAQELPTTV